MAEILWIFINRSRNNEDIALMIVTGMAGILMNSNENDGNISE